MARQVKCPYCQNLLNKDESYEYKKRYYHPECFNEWKQESDDRKDLIAYICELYRLDVPTGMILKQIKEFREEFNYKYKGMELALRYFYETLGNPIQESSGIGIIPYVYEEAKKNYILKMQVAESLKNLKQEETQVIEVYSPKSSSYKSKIKHIDINSL